MILDIERVSPVSLVLEINFCANLGRLPNSAQFLAFCLPTFFYFRFSGIISDKFHTRTPQIRTLSSNYKGWKWVGSQSEWGLCARQACLIKALPCVVKPTGGFSILQILLDFLHATGGFSRHFLLLVRTYTLPMFQICFPTFKLRFIVQNILYFEGSPGAGAAGYLLHPGGQDPPHGHLLPDPHLSRRDHRSVEGCRYCTVGTSEFDKI